MHRMSTVSGFRHTNKGKFLLFQCLNIIYVIFAQHYGQHQHEPVTILEDGRIVERLTEPNPTLLPEKKREIEQNIYEQLSRIPRNQLTDAKMKESIEFVMSQLQQQTGKVMDNSRPGQNNANQGSIVLPDGRGTISFGHGQNPNNPNRNSNGNFQGVRISFGPGDPFPLPGSQPLSNDMTGTPIQKLNAVDGGSIQIFVQNHGEAGHHPEVLRHPSSTHQIQSLKDEPAPAILPDGSIRVPRYFRNGLDPDRVLTEVQYFKSRSRWSQRVLLEILYHSILGVELDEYKKNILPSASRQSQDLNEDLPVALYEHPIRNELRKFHPVKNMKDWLKSDVHICHWEGITCHDTSLPKVPVKTFTFMGNGEETLLNITVGKPFCACVKKEELNNWDWPSKQELQRLKQHSSSCECPSNEIVKRHAPKNAVTKIHLPNKNLLGQIPYEMFQMPFLQELSLPGNMLFRILPSSFGLLTNLQHLDLSESTMNENLPSEFSLLNQTLRSLRLSGMMETPGGTIPDAIFTLISLEILDLSQNQFGGTIPIELGTLTNLKYLNIGNNQFTGSIPSELGQLKSLKALILDHNILSGTLPTELESCTNLVDLNVENNKLTGTIPGIVRSLQQLDSLRLGHNDFSGSLPSPREFGLNHLPGWLSLRQNSLTGTIPGEMFSSKLRALDLSMNQLSGRIPHELKSATNLSILMLRSCGLEGLLPSVLANLSHLRELDITGNRLRGVIDKQLANQLKKAGSITSSRKHYVACPGGTFHPDGAANILGSCTKCNSCEGEAAESSDACQFLGQYKCVDRDEVFLRGDVNGDGMLSQREVLRLWYIDSAGPRWGKTYQNWANQKVPACELAGVNCKNNLVTKIDLRGAKICNGTNNSTCTHLPREIAHLGPSLEVLDLSNSWDQSIGSIPKEVGLLTNLKILDLSGNVVGSTLPAEIGNCKELRMMNFARTQLNGPIPSSLGNLQKLEKLNLGHNNIKGTLPSQIGRLKNLRELMIPVAHLHGTIPSEICNLGQLRIMEMYGNSLKGTLPEGLSKLASLKKIDLYGNLLEGSAAEIFQMTSGLEIIHLKQNKFTGTLPNIGNLHDLTWFDISSNSFEGEIPSSISKLKGLKNLHLGDNYFQPPIPASLCSMERVDDSNHAVRRSCDNVLCGLGYYSKTGYATEDHKCIPCEENQTTIYLGSYSCTKLTKRDFLGVLYSAANGDGWSSKDSGDWFSKAEECDWEGVSCDENGAITDISFPLYGLEYNEELLLGLS